MNKLDAFLNKISMYRVVLYGLVLICGTAMVMSFAGLIAYPVLSLAVSLAVVLGSGLIIHYALRWAFKAGTSPESWLVTALILFLILKPADDIKGYAVLILGVALAMASKYIFAVMNRHIFNPVAIALVILGLLGSGEVYWWVGADVLLPVVLVAGLLVVHKVRHHAGVLVFVLLALLTFSFSSGIGLQPVELFNNAILSGPLVFFATIMLLEPATSPQNKYMRIVYGGLVGVLYGMSFTFGPISSSPELALVAGNVFAYTVNYKRRHKLTLIQQQQQGGGIYEFSFHSEHVLKFKPGQYFEWTLPHHRPDSRGNRRYFTIASSPEESDIKLGVRFDPMHSSSFKKALLQLAPGDIVWASQLGGDFVMPRKKSKKIVMIAGGVGITPFRSMIRHIIDTNQKRDITLFYCSLTADGFAYWQLCNQAVQNGVKPYYVITGQDIPSGWTGLTGFLSPEMIQQKVPDYKDALFYLSGPHAMIVGYKKMLQAFGVPRSHIKTDYFPGF